MDPHLPILLFGSFGVLLFLNFPIAAALGISSVLVIAVFDLAPLELIPQQLLSATDSWTLLAVPFFILAGNILAKTAISERLIRLARVVVGQFPAGLAMVAVIVSIFFAGISGSGPADTAALGAILIPGMVAAGYDRRSAAALMAAGGGIGIIIPPSIALVIYGVVANASISKLFIAGILPGILVGLSLFAVSYLLFGKDPNIRPEKRGSLREIGAAFKDAAWGLLAPIIILGGIYGGIFTATEAATVAVVYGVIVGFFIHRDLKLSDLPEILIDTGVTTGVVMLLVCTASVFAWVLNTSGVAAAAAAGLMHLASGKIGRAAADQRGSPGRGLLHGRHLDLLHPAADPPAGGQGPRDRPRPLRDRDDGEHGDRPDHAPGRGQPLRRLRDRPHFHEGDLPGRPPDGRRPDRGAPRHQFLARPLPLPHPVHAVMYREGSAEGAPHSRISALPGVPRNVRLEGRATGGSGEVAVGGGAQ